MLLIQNLWNTRPRLFYDLQHYCINYFQLVLVGHWGDFQHSNSSVVDQWRFLL
jgi:hypothetical protein